MSEPATPPPTIGKMGPYTVFITHPSDPSDPPVQSPPVLSSHPVQPPPVQYPKSTSPKSGFIWDAVAKVQKAHSSLDEYVAHWFGLNQSKYQWALDDYYESKGSQDKVDAQVTHAAPKAQRV
ncbi:uncharacterized protein LOC110886146 isoform X2 [Helianthus annuus]|uniref:uncharacterized protein LOC110886146 isoform X2 n=1 Tax=Helianthus annuus TaxID=4232 RepID=UPI000B900C0B|nr:uncharacterized protein LOC110886146 isoform X2 [Helianthus annuus]